MPLGAFRQSQNLANIIGEPPPPGTVWNKSTRYNNDLIINGSNLTHSTAQFRFGTASLFANSSATSADYWQTTVTATDFGSGNWTIEGWYRLTSIDSAGVFRTLLRGDTNDSTAIGVSLRSFGNGTYGIQYVWQGESFNGNANGTSGTIAINTWYHWAISRSSSLINVYGNGTRTSSRSTTKSNLFGTAGVVRLFGSNHTNWYQDSFRLSNSARYTGTTLTVPTTQFASDANTRLLMHFNGANGTQITTDSTV